jgi:hypothetical protein
MPTTRGDVPADERQAVHGSAVIGDEFATRMATDIPRAFVEGRDPEPPPSPEPAARSRVLALVRKD